jgi:hypothetical protein
MIISTNKLNFPIWVLQVGIPLNSDTIYQINVGSYTDECSCNDNRCNVGDE